MDLYAPRVGSRSAKGADYFWDSVDAETNRLLKYHETHRPQLDEEIKNRVKAVLAKSGLEEQYFANIENM